MELLTENKAKAIADACLIVGLISKYKPLWEIQAAINELAKNNTLEKLILYKKIGKSIIDNK